MRWNPGKKYEVKGAEVRSMTVTAAGEVVVWVACGSLDSPCYEARWYDQQGELLKTLPGPPECGNSGHVLAIETGGEQQVALSCHSPESIWLGSRKAEAWGIAWQGTSNEESGGYGILEPYKICQGKPGNIIAVNGLFRHSVSVFDITQIPFCLVEPEIELAVKPWYLCYCDLPGVGRALAATDGDDGEMWEAKLGMFSLDSGALMWSAGGKDGKGQKVKVAGAEWWPCEVCSDDRGRLYVADRSNNRIIVFSAASGSVLQVVQGRGHIEVVKDIEDGWDGWGLEDLDVPDKDEWVVDTGITVYGPDVRYTDDNPKKGVASGSVLQEIEDYSLKWPIRDLCWCEETKSIIVSDGNGISYMQIEF